MRGESSCLTPSGTRWEGVTSAYWSARAHSQLRAAATSIRRRAARRTAFAVFAFLPRLAMIWSTVTESCSGCQQS